MLPGSDLLFLRGGSSLVQRLVDSTADSDMIDELVGSSIFLRTRKLKFFLEIFNFLIFLAQLSSHWSNSSL